MAWVDTHGRFGLFVDQLIAAYPLAANPSIDPAWFVGAENLSQNHGAPRVVAWFLEGRGVPYRAGAISPTDSVVLVRVPRVHLAIWMPTPRRLENAVHAMIEALDAVTGLADSTWTVADVREQWFPAALQITHGGVAMDLSFDLAINVLASDRRVVESDADPGAGTPRTAATSLTLGGAITDTREGAAPLAIPDLTLTTPED